MKDLQMFLRALLLLLTCVYLAPAAQAAAIDEEGAQHLKGVFQDFIDFQQHPSGANPGTGLIYDGEIIVEPAGSYYAVTLPHAKLRYPDGDMFDIGMVSINASPHNKAGQWKMTVALPTPMTLSNAKNSGVVRVDIGQQRTAGIWDETLANFVKLDAEYKDITATLPSGTLTLPISTILYDLEQDENGLWSGPGVLTTKNITLDFKNSAARGKIDEIKASIELDRYDAQVLKDYRENVLALSELDEKNTASKNQILGYYNMISDILLKAGNGFKSNYAVSGIHLTRPPVLGEGPDDELNINSAFFGFDMAGFLDGSVGMALRFGHNGLAMSTIEPEIRDTMPTESNINIKINNLPLQNIADLGKTSLQSALTSPEMAQIAGIGLLFKLPALLSQAGTHLELRDNYMGNGEYKVTLNGDVKADMSAVNSMTMDMKAAFYGLDKHLARLKKFAADPENERAGDFARMAERLEKIKSMARPETGPEGETYYVLDIVMTPQGQIKINGQDGNIGDLIDWGTPAISLPQPELEGIPH